MFDIGFWELVMVGVVALIVVGPERLPGLARTAGLWLGKARYFVSSVKAEIDRELKAEELRRILEEHVQIPEMDDFIEETRQSLSETHDALRAALEPAFAPTTPIGSIVSASTSVALDDIPDDFRNAFPDDVPAKPIDPPPPPTSTVVAESTTSVPAIPEPPATSRESSS